MLGLTTDFNPRFVRRYESFAERAHDAAKRYSEDVKQGAFPSEEESY